MCVCISLSAYVTLFCLFSPKISIILLHPDKNVRKLTMNSATYKRAFKPMSSVASVDGRNNLASGGAQPDAASGGPLSNTSNVLNIGESSKNKKGNNKQGRTRREDKLNGAEGDEEEETLQYHSCICFLYDCRWLGFGQCFWSIVNAIRNFSPTKCWLSFTAWLGRCCSLGELGPTMAELELSSVSSTPRPSTSQPTLSRPLTFGPS